MCLAPKTYKSIISIIFVCFSFNVKAIELFYDSQLDYYIKKITKDIVEKSEIEDVNIYIAKSSEINAFATSNKEIVIYSGLIERSKNAEQIKGVLAHELGHLVANHHIKTIVKNSNGSLPGIAGTIIGLGAVIAGAPQVGYAAIVSGGAAGVSKQLSYSREHENEADSIALKLLESTDNSTGGLAEFFAILEKQENNFLQKRPEFLNTHPATEKRKAFVLNNTSGPTNYNLEQKAKNDISEDNVEFSEFKAKIYALTEPSDKTFNKYSIEDDSISKYLALSIAALSMSNFKQSLNYLDQSHKLGLADKWYYDILGQIHCQRLEFEESLIAYKKSVELGNNSWIMDFQIAESYFEYDTEKSLAYYFKALSKFDSFYYTLQRLSQAYAKMGKMAYSHYYLASYYLKIDDKKQAEDHAKLALSFYKKEILRNDDLKFKIDELLKIFKKEE